VSLRALIWDVDGTLAESECDGHRVAFNDAFAALSLPWHWSVERYGGLLSTSGGLERLLRDMAERDDAPRAAGERLALARELHERKNRAYADVVASGAITLRPGVRRLMQQAHDGGGQLAIVTTTGRANVDALLSRQLDAHWADGFAAVVCADDAPLKKPHPQAYQLEIQIARAYHIEGKHDVEIEHFKKYLEKNPADIQVKLLAGSEMISKGNADEGKALLASIDESQVKEAAIFVNVGINLMNQNKAKDALPFFDKAINRFPNDPDAYYYRGITNIQLGTTLTPDNKEEGDKLLAAGKADLTKFVAMAPTAPAPRAISQGRPGA